MTRLAVVSSADHRPAEGVVENVVKIAVGMTTQIWIIIGAVVAWETIELRKAGMSDTALPRWRCSPSCASRGRYDHN